MLGRKELDIYNIFLLITMKIITNMFMKIKVLYIILGLSIIFFSCIKEDQDSCQMNAIAGHKIQFINIDKNPSKYNYLWDFGDGSESDEEAPTHIYNMPGVYSVNVIRYRKSGAFISKDCFYTIEVKQKYRPKIGYIYIYRLDEFLSHYTFLTVNKTVYFEVYLPEEQLSNRNEYTSKLEIEKGIILQEKFNNYTYLDYNAKFTHTFTDTGVVNLKFSIFDKYGTTESIDTTIYIHNQEKYNIN